MKLEETFASEQLRGTSVGDVKAVYQHTNPQGDKRVEYVREPVHAGGAASGRYPEATQKRTQREMHKVLQVRGWKGSGTGYLHPDFPDHNVTTDANGAWVYTAGAQRQTGHTKDQLMVCMDKMAGKKY